MKHIKKGEPPGELIAWAAANAGLPSLQYGDGGFPHAVVHQALIAEQGGICAYTMVSINEDKSHIEHLKPQAVSRAERNFPETANYQNIVACFPKRHVAGKPKYKFGAIFREDAWDSLKFVSPLNTACEMRIRFGTDGTIRPWRSTDTGAVWTIQILGLDESVLTEWREAAIEARGLSLLADDPLPKKDVERIIEHICDRDSDGNFVPYCVAIKHAAEEFLGRLEKKAKQKKYARASRKQRRK